VGLLTRLPIGHGIANGPGAAAFGIVGATVGLIAAIPFLVLAAPVHEPVLAAIAAVAVVVVLSGAMHLDGLADTADALLARDVMAAEQARTDPAVGAGGVVAVVLTVAAEVAALASIAATATPLAGASTIVVACGIARVAPVLLARTERRWPSAPGLGSWFASQVTTMDAAIAVLTVGGFVAVEAIVTTAPIALATLAGGIVGLTVGRALVARRGVDGDALGASVEVTFTAILVAVAIALS
jgi:adenosylcobinamide-GDP ribazoletransferase